MKKTFTKFNTAVIFFLGVFIAFSSNAQEFVAVPGIVGQLTFDAKGQVKCDLHAHDEVAQSHHRSLEANATAKKSKAYKKKAGGGATIFVDYYVVDPTFTDADAAVAAFQSAVDIWAENIQSDVPIYVAAVFRPLGTNVLGSAGPTEIYANVPGLERDTWYGNALADKLVGADLNSSQYDIVANFSTVYTNWYFGTDGNTPAEDLDFRSVVLHELGHGLGFFGSMYVENETGVADWGFLIPSPIFPAIYDRFAFEGPGKLLLNRYENFSTELGDVLLNSSISFRGNATLKATNGKGANLFTILDLGDNEIPGLTNVWLPGSSYSHLDYLTYLGTDDALMVPFLSRGVAFDDPGSIVKAMFADMGWNGKIRKPYVAAAVRTADGDQLQSASSIRLFPNHVHDRFTLDLSSANAKLTGIRMTDTLGKTYDVKYANNASGVIEFDLSASNMKTGIYILQLNLDNHKTETIRISKIQ